MLANMEEMAGIGLRTLLFGMKELTEGDVSGIETNDDPTSFETGLTLLGVTGIEDLLQDNVAKCVSEFKRAKCKVWMLTGDKGATARSVGITCGLIDTKKQKIIKVEEFTTVAELETRLDQILEEELESSKVTGVQTN